jgi:hypothetical protein
LREYLIVELIFFTNLVTDSMGEIFKSPIPCDPSKLPTDLSLPDYVFQKLNKLLPQVADNPWLVRDIFA